MKNNLNKLAPKILTGWWFQLLMIITVIVWAFAFPFIRIGLDELSFINLTILRLFIVCILFLIIFLIQPKSFSKLHKKDILPIFLLGFSGLVVYHLGLNYGELRVSPSTASLIIATIPIFIVILAAIFLKEKITMKKAIGVIISFLGVIIISLWSKNDIEIEGEYLLAALAVFIAAIVGAIYTIGGKKLLQRYSGLSLTAYAFLFGSLSLIPLLLPSINNSFIMEVSHLSYKGWFAVIFLGVFSTVIGYVIWYVALKVRNASEISVYLYLVPIGSTIISYFLLNIEITLLFIFGAILVILGLIIVNMKEKLTKN